MSRDWNIHCLDCGETCHFNDANHQVELMLALIRQAPAIAAVDALSAEPKIWDLELRANSYRVDTGFFKRHYGHRLAPIDEYGKIEP